MLRADAASHDGRATGPGSVPTVSVVIPFYNAAAHLPGALAAVAAQSFTDWEVVVVDDASPESPDGVLAQWQDDPRIRLVRHASNLGASAARNTGIAEARGRFVAFLDADDDWFPAKLERQLTAVMAQADPDRVFCVTSTIVKLTEVEHLLRPIRGKRPDERLDEFIFVGGGFCQTSSFLVSTELARRVGFRKLPIGEDHLFAIDLCNAGAEYLLIDEPLAVYDDRFRPGRLSGRASLSIGHEFMAHVADTLSAKALLGYESRYLGTFALRANPLKGLRLVARALAGGAISPRYATMLIARTMVPARVYHTIRSRLLGRRRAT